MTCGLYDRLLTVGRLGPDGKIGLPRNHPAQPVTTTG